jgi:dynein light chain 1, axonemal
MKKLKVLYISYNEISEWAEVGKLSVLSETLENLKFEGNPLVDEKEFEDYHPIVMEHLPFLKTLDGEFVEVV